MIDLHWQLTVSRCAPCQHPVNILTLIYGNLFVCVCACKCLCIQLHTNMLFMCVCGCVHRNWLEFVCLPPTLHLGACFISTFTELHDAKQCRINKKTQLVKCNLADKVTAGEKHNNARGRMTGRRQCERELACRLAKSGEERGEKEDRRQGTQACI